MTSGDRRTEPDALHVADYLGERVGLSLTGSRRGQLLHQIVEAMAEAGVEDGRWYCEVLERDTAAFDTLVSRITVGESYFFREPGQLDVLRSTILPERRTTRGCDASLNLWSAGCSTGQEPYTLAIVLDEEGVARQSRILATDISSEALAVAATGIFAKWSLRAVTDRQREAFFDPAPIGYRVHTRFARSITFRQVNLLDPSAMAKIRGMDVIFCRNVLIYLTPDSVARAAGALAAALLPGGWLVTGSSDPPLDAIANLEPNLTPAGVMYRRPSPGLASAVHRRTIRAADVPAHRPAASVPAPVDVQARPPHPTVPVPLPAAIGPADADEVARILRALGGEGKLTDALSTASEAVARFPVNAEIRYLQAVVLLEAGRPDDAVAAARAAIYLDPDLIVAHVTMAQAQAALGDFNAARNSFRNASALLQAMPVDAPVPLGDGELAGRLAAMISAYAMALGTA